jgi:ABC-2 type transport system permease protein
MTAVAGVERAAEPAGRFTDLLAAECLKLWTVRSIRWFGLLSALMVIGINVNGTRADLAHWDGMNSGDRAYYARIGAPLAAFDRASASWMMIFLGALGAVTILNESTTGMFRTMFVAVPARREALAAKIVTVGGLATVFGAVMSGVSFWATQAMLGPARGGVSLGAPGAIRRLVVAALLAPIMALVGMALGALLRHAIAAMVVLFGTVFIIPVFLRDDHHTTAVIDHMLVFKAWDRLIQIGSITGEPYPWTRAGAWAVYALWPLAAIVVTVVLVDRHDQ